MLWLYRLQQRLAITRNEGLAIVTVAGLLLLGLAVRQVQAPVAPHDPSTYEEVAARFRAHTANLPGANRAASDTNEATASPDAPASAERINLNTATRAELRRLPGIGPALSARIAAYREANGPFARIEDVTRVRGIGEKTLAQIEPMLYVEVASAPK